MKTKYTLRLIKTERIKKLNVALKIIRGYWEIEY